MKLSFFKSESQAFPRCEHRSPSGRQCSQPVCSNDPRFCGAHKPTPEQLAAAELSEAAGTLSSPDEIHRFLKAVLFNRVRGRITPKEASVYSYLCQNLLRSLREIDHFNELHAEREHRNLRQRACIWEVPRADRSDPPTPASTDSIVVQPPAIAADNVEAALPALSLTEGRRPPLPAKSPVPTTSPTTSTASNPPAVAASPSKSSTSSTSSTSNPPFDPRHFYPFDPTLPRGVQDHSRNIPPPDEAECRRLAARRGLLFNRRRPVFPGALR